MLVQQVEPVLDVPVAVESPLPADKGQDIFSALLLLSLTGNCCAGSGGFKDVYPLPPSEDQAQGYQDTSSSIPIADVNLFKMEEQDLFSPENNSIPTPETSSGQALSLPLKGREFSDSFVPRRDMGGASENVTLNLFQGLNEMLKQAMKQVQAKVQHDRKKGFSDETFMSQDLMSVSQKIVDIPSQINDAGLGKPTISQSGGGVSQHSRILEDSVIFVKGSNPVDTTDLKGARDLNLTIALHPSAAPNDNPTDPVSLPRTEDGVIAVSPPDFFKDGEHQGDCSTNSSDKGGREGIGESGFLTYVMKTSVRTDTNCNLQPIHKYIDQEKIIQHLSQRLIHASHARTHTARIRLKPEELGDICMDISVIDNNVKAFIAVENYDVKEIVEANLKRLEEELKNHGLRIDQFIVEMKGGGSGDRFMSASHWKDTVNKRGVGRILFDRSVNQGSLNDSVITGSGVISIFA